jgi:cytochrome c oxidase subunit IV
MAHDHGHGSAVAPGAHAEHAHPTERVYVTVALILGIVTAIEVAIYYIEALDDILVPALLILSAGKFVAVVGYFMHLKFDDVLFRWIFIFGLTVAAACYLGMAAMFLYHTWDVV